MQEPEAAKSPQEEDAWEGLHNRVTGRVRTAASWIDGFLSDDRSLAETNRSWVSLRTEASVDQRGEDDFAPRIGGRLLLPASEKRWHLAFGSSTEDDDDEQAEAASTAPAPEEIENRETNLALQYTLRETRGNNVRTELGARFDDLDPDPYIGLRWRHSFNIGSWLGRATERARAYADAGLDTKTTLDFDTLIDEEHFFRATTYGRWREEESGVDYGERFSLHRRLNSTTLVISELDVEFVTQPRGVMEATTARLRVSHRWDRGRILFEVVPQLAWRREDDFEASAGLALVLEILFGREESP